MPMDRTPQLDPGDNAKYLSHSMRAWNLPKIKMNDPDAVMQRSVEYLNGCIEDDMKPTITGYANYLGITRVQLYRIATGQSGNGKAIDIITQVKSFIEEQMENYMMNGKINPISAIFLLKNNFGYKDQQEVTVTTSPIEQVDKERIAQNYADFLPQIEDNDDKM